MLTLADWLFQRKDKPIIKQQVQPPPQKKIQKKTKREKLVTKMIYSLMLKQLKVFEGVKKTKKKKI